MTNERRHKITEIFAYRYAEICKANGVYHDNDYNWKRAVEMVEMEIRINGEEFTSHLFEKEDENEQKI
jgi:hypothetical protein